MLFVTAMFATTSTYSSVCKALQETLSSLSDRRCHVMVSLKRAVITIGVISVLLLVTTVNRSTLYYTKIDTNENDLTEKSYDSNIGASSISSSTVAMAAPAVRAQTSRGQDSSSDYSAASFDESFSSEIDEDSSRHKRLKDNNTSGHRQHRKPPNRPAAVVTNRIQGFIRSISNCDPELYPLAERQVCIHDACKHGRRQVCAKGCTCTGI